MKLFKRTPKAQRKVLKNYKKHFGVNANVENPTTFCEKVLYRQKYKSETPLFTMLADKYAVREYVTDKIGEQYLVPLLAYYENYKELVTNLHQYQGEVVKTNHGSRMVYLVPKKLTKADIRYAKTRFRKWMSRDYSVGQGEMQYKNIPRKLLVEKFIGDKETLPVDYKIHLFKSKNNEFNYTLETISGRGTDAIESSYFVNNLDTADIGSFKMSDSEKTKVLQAIELSKALMGQLEYARIDWYIFENAIYFGEITLTPAAGVDKDMDNALNDKMGAFWDMSLIEY